MAANTSLHENLHRERTGVRLGVAVGALVLFSQCLSNLDGLDSGSGTNNGSGGTGGGLSGSSGRSGGGVGAAGSNAGAGGEAGGQGGGQGGDAGAGGRGGSVVNPKQKPAVYNAEPGWCAPVVADPEIEFCADFDSEATTIGSFDALPDTEPRFATLLPTSSEPSSPSNALLVYAQPTSPGDVGGFQAKVSKKFVEGVSSFTLSFDFRPELMNTGGARAVIAAVEFLDSSKETYALQIACAQGELQLEEAYPEANPAVPRYVHPRFSVTPNEWTRIELVANLDGSDPSAGEGGAAGDAGTGGNGGSGAGGAGGSAGKPTAIIRTGPAGGPLTQVGIARTLRFLNGSSFDRKPLLSIGVPQGEFHHTGWALRFDNVVFDLRR